MPPEEQTRGIHIVQPVDTLIAAPSELAAALRRVTVTIASLAIDSISSGYLGKAECQLDQALALVRIAATLQAD